MVVSWPKVFQASWGNGENFVSDCKKKASVEFAAERSRNPRSCLKDDLSYNQNDQPMGVRGHLIDSFGLELNLRQVSDGLDFNGEKGMLGRERERKYVCYWESKLYFSLQIRSLLQEKKKRRITEDSREFWRIFWI